MSGTPPALAACPFCGEKHDEDTLRCPDTDMMLPLEGRRLDGKFRFLSTLGAGGMASVYLAINERVDREVAIKFLRPEVSRDPEAVARFRSEAKAAGRIGNRHICEILDLGDSPIGPYIVMERLRGVDLADLIKQQGRLQPGYAVRVVRHSLEGLAAAHGAGIVHRDLKPGNIFLHRDRHESTVVKLMDFGVSKFLDGSNEAQTASGILLGTPEYMAPEQLEGAHKIGPAADIFAMGAILYRAISGRQVFSGPNLAAVLRSMALDEVTPISQLVEGLPPALEAIIHRCLARDVAARYATASELSDALEPFEQFEGEVALRPDPPPRRIDTEFVPQTIPSDPTPPPVSPSMFVSEEARVSALADTGAVASPPPLPQAAQKPAESKRRMGPLLLLLLVVAGGAGLGWWVMNGGLEGGDASGGQEPVELGALPGPDADALAVDTQLPDIEAPAARADLGGAPSETTLSEPALPELELAESSGGESETSGAESETGETGAEGETGEGETAESEGDDETGESKPSYIAGTDRPAPSGTFRGGAYISPNDAGGNTDLAGAKAFCSGLATRSFAGTNNWKLANPAELSKFVGNNQVRRARYWTTALNQGKAWTYNLPSGKKSSEKASRRIARPLCVAKY